jgi:hypothetical protein
LLFSRSQTIPDVPLVAYPETPRGRADYVRYTARDLDRFADHGAKKYASMGLVSQVVYSKSKVKSVSKISFRVWNPKPELLLFWRRQIWITLPVSFRYLDLDIRFCYFQIVLP